MVNHRSSDEIIEHFTLTSDDHSLLPDRNEHGRLGFAVFLKFFQANGRFPVNPGEVRQEVIDYVAEQIGVSPRRYERYQGEGRSIERHRAIIRSITGFREITAEDNDALIEWLIEYFNANGVAHSHEVACDRLRELKIELPTADRLSRIVNSAVYMHEQQLYERIHQKLSVRACRQLDKLIEIRKDNESGFSQIREDPGPIGLSSIC